MALRPLQETFVMNLELLGGALAAHRPAQPVGLPGRVAGEYFGHLHHLVLEDDRPERLGENLLERRMLVGDLV